MRFLICLDPVGVTSFKFFRHFMLVATTLTTILFSLSLLAAPNVSIGTPEWIVPTAISTDDGYADLQWQNTGDEFAELYKVTERRLGSKREFYVDHPGLRVYRVEPGRYRFKVAACRKNADGFPECGQNSNKLRLTVTEAIFDTFPHNDPEPSVQTFSAPVDGGPDQLRPGLWYDPNKDGQGWSFFWANRLALPESDPLFGNVYDLVGVYYTFEAKNDPSAPGEPSPFFEAYRPVVATFKAILTAPNTYSGVMSIVRQGVADSMGSAIVTFGPNNNSATIDWDMNFKLESLSDIDSLSLLLGPDPGSINNETHYSGLWEHASDDSYFVVNDIGSIAEAATLVFYDNAGDPTWVQAANVGSAVSGNTYFCFSYISDGYRANRSTPVTWSQVWYDSGCNSSQSASSSNRNGRRYFSDFGTERFWASFTIAGIDYSSGSINVGSNSSPAYLEKKANFHGISYDYLHGSSCTMTNTTPSCTAQLTWFTDSDYPNATAFAYNQTTLTRTKVLTSTEPTMENQSHALTGEGVYVFELRMGDSPTAKLIAQSVTFTVTSDFTEPPLLLPEAVHGTWDDKANSKYRLRWRYADTQMVDHYEIEETLPDGTTATFNTTPPGTNMSLVLNKSGGQQGRYQYRIRACNVGGCSGYTSFFNWFTADPSGVDVFSDNFETIQSWIRNLAGSDSAYLGRWERANPQQSYGSGYTFQRDDTVSGNYCLVTEGQFGTSINSNDVDNGDTTFSSPSFTVPTGGVTALRFHYYLAHMNSTSADFFRAYADTQNGDVLLLEKLASSYTKGAAWLETAIDLSAFAGQSIRIRFEAADNASASTVEAAVDDVSVLSFSVNSPPAFDTPIPSSLSFIENSFGTHTVSFSDVDNGDTHTCSFFSGSLPTGLTLSTDVIGDNCMISGTPTGAPVTNSIVLKVSDGTDSAYTTSIDVVVSTQTANPETPPAPAGPPSLVPSVSSSGVGATAGQFRVDESGSATYNIPILTAPGSGGVAPQISLSYSNQAGNGHLGVGWNLVGLSSITRCAQTVEQDSVQGNPPPLRHVTLTQTDRFCLDGQRLLLVPNTGSYGDVDSEYRTEIDGISRIRLKSGSGNNPPYFTVERKDGSISEYGNIGGSRIEARNGANAGTALVWAQNRFEDSAGNYITYSYTESSAGPIEYVIDKITYSEGKAELNFEYSTRDEYPLQTLLLNDELLTYVAGEAMEQTKLITRIDVESRIDSTDPSMAAVRSFFMDYDSDGMGRAIINSIEECNNSSKSVCFNPTNFSWLKSLHEIETTDQGDSVLPIGEAIYGLQLADVSGDGRPDLIYTLESGEDYFIHIKKPSGTGSFSTWGSGSGYLVPKKNSVPSNIFGIDLNADGYQDVIYRKHVNGDTFKWMRRLSSGSSLGAEGDLSQTAWDFALDESDPKTATRISVVDFNGDGLGDLLNNKSERLPDDNKLVFEVALNTGDPNGQLSSPDEYTAEFTPNLLPKLLPQKEVWNEEVYAAKTPEGERLKNKVFDFNGDGKVDLLRLVWRQFRECTSNCELPLNSPDSADEPLVTQAGSGPVYSYTIASFWVVISATDTEVLDYQVVARGAGCTTLETCLYNITLPASDYMLPVDINVDGLADLVYANGHKENTNHWFYMLNNGAGFNAPTQLTSSRLPGYTNELVRFEDMNGDGYPDLMYPSEPNNQSATWMVLYNDFGNYFSAAVDTGLPVGEIGSSQNGDSDENDATIFADFTGNGKLDQLFFNYDKDREIPSNLDSGLYKGRNFVTSVSGTEASNVIKTFTNGMGAVTQLSYLPLTDTDVYTRMNDAVGVKGENEWGNGAAVYDLIAPIYVVRETSGSAPVFGSSTAMSSVKYHYVGAKMQGGGRGFLGFGEVISYDLQSGIRTNTRYRQDFPFIGMPVDTMRARNASGSKSGRLSNTSAGTPPNWSSVSSTTTMPSSPGGIRISYSINEWSTKVTEGNALFPYIVDSLDRSYTLSGVFDRKVLTSSSYDTYGNLISSTVRTYASDGTSAFATQSTSNTYAENDGVGNDDSTWQSNWLLGRLATSSVSHSRPGKSTVRSSSFTYNPVNGILIQEVIEPNPGDEQFKVTTDYELDAHGNREKATVTGYDMVPRESEQVYDNLGRFVIQSENALKQVTLKINSWDVFGNPLTSENIDGIETTSAADLMGRPFASYTETGVWKKITNSTGPGSYCPTGTVFRTTITGGGAPTRVQCFDQLGRAIRTAAKSFDGSYTYTDQYYDSSGRVERISEPYFAGDSRYWNITVYDEVGRPLTQKLTSDNGTPLFGNDGSYQQDYTYDDSSPICNISPGPRSVIITNGRGLERVETKNALGETEFVYDDQCGEISYGYDAVGNLTSVEGADNKAVIMTYNKAGRKTTMKDPDKGYWQYAYNPLGEMTRQLDSKSQAIDFTYDKLSRITNRRELSSVTTIDQSSGYTTVNKETTSFKSSSYGKGQVGSITYRDGESGSVLHKKEMIYDSFGRLDIVSTTIGSEIFAEQTTYDQYSRVFQQFDVSGEDHGLRYFYANGYVSKIKEARDGTAGLVYQDISTMDARGNVTEMQLGNGVDVIAAYEPASGRLEKLEAWDGAIMIQDVEYLFDVLGNLKKRHDRSVSLDLKETFNYDDLNRLDDVNLSVNGAQAVTTLSLDYDIGGNITYKSDVGTYSYNPARPHAVSSTTDGNSYLYDANGNQTSGDGRAIDYTVFDKPYIMTKGNSQVDFSYGVGNSRYQRKDYEGAVLQKTTLYLGSTERITENGSTFFKRYLGGVAIATYYPTTGVQQFAYLLKDHIGSIHTVLDEDGNITARMHFSAFGQRRDLTDWQTPLTSFQFAALNDITSRGFTGHEQVDSMGVVHMNGRIYDPKLGRFLQADPLVQDPKNSQNLNRYSYVLNNPLSYTDPSGYFIKELAYFVAAIVRVIYTWEDPSAWVYLAASAKNLVDAFGKQQGGMPRGVVAGAFINGFTAVAQFAANNIRHEPFYVVDGPAERVRLATIGGTGSGQTDWKNTNGAGFGAFAYTIAIGAGETALSLPGGGFIDFLYAGARKLPALAGGTITVLAGGIFYPSGLLDDPLTHPSYCPNGCTDSLVYGGRLGNDPTNTTIQINERLSKKASNSKVGDKVMTPDHPDFPGVSLPGGQGVRNKKTGEIWQNDRARHSGSGPHRGSRWKVGNKPGALPRRGNKTTVGADGTILKKDP